MKSCSWHRAAVVVCVLGVGVLEGDAGQLFVATGRDTLKNLPGVEVVVEPLPAEQERGELSTAALATAVRLQLSRAGVVVYANQRANPSPAKPYLYLHVSIVGTDDDRLRAVGLQLHLRQTLASVVTESRVVDAMSWDAHEVVLVPSAMLDAAISSELATLVDRFVEDWRAAH